MSDATLPIREVAAFWQRVNDDITALVDSIPDDRMEWSPQPDLWNFRRILLHIASARDYWMGKIVQDGESPPSVYETVRTKDDVREAYARTWDRMRRFLGDPERLAAGYVEDAPVNGYWIALHVLEHDIHHRADLLHYLALLGVETPEVGTP